MSCLYLLSFIAFAAAFTSLGSYFHVLKQKAGIVRPLFSFMAVIVDLAMFDMLARRTFDITWQNHAMSRIYKLLKESL